MTSNVMFLVVVLAAAMCSASEVSGTSFLTPEWVSNNMSPDLGRHVALTPCSLFVGQRAEEDTALWSPLFETKLAADKVDNLRVVAHSRFLSTSEGQEIEIVDSDLFVGISDGENVYGFTRVSPTESSSLWGHQSQGSMVNGKLESLSVLSGAQCEDCDIDNFETFELTYTVGKTLEVSVRTLYGEGFSTFSFDADLTGKPLTLVVYLGEWDHAYELAGFMVTLNTAKFLGASLIPGFDMLDEDNQPMSGLRMTSDRTHELARGCGVVFGAESVPGQAFAGLLSTPLVPASVLSSDKPYVVDFLVGASLDSDDNQLFLGLESGDHVVGFARAGEAEKFLGWAVGGTTVDNGFYVPLNEYAAVEMGSEGSIPETVHFRLVVKGDHIEVHAGPVNNPHATVSFDGVSTELDLSLGLNLVVMQGAESEQASTIRFVAVTVDEMAVGCDGVVGSTLSVDKCGVCGGSDECVGCDGIAFSGFAKDACNVCGGDGTSCVDCEGVRFGSSKLDACGICNGDNACLKEELVLGTEEADAPRHQLEARSEYHALLRDCEGTPMVMGGYKEYDACGVCGGNNECFGCDGVANSGLVYDVCGVCGGDNSTCCHNYLDVQDEFWDFLLLPVTIEDLIEKFEYTYDLLYWINENLPTFEQVQNMESDLMIGTMAEFNRIFLDDCLCNFCEKSGDFYSQLVHNNFLDHKARRYQHYLYDGTSDNSYDHPNHGDSFEFYGYGQNHHDNFAYSPNFHSEHPSAGDFERGHESYGYANHPY